MTDYQVAIPSFDRPDLTAKTISNLIGGGVPLSRITVFCSAPDQIPAYQAAAAPAAGGVAIEPGALGIAANRNHITGYYPPATNVVSVDDDITLISGLSKGRLAPFTDLDAFFRQAWAIAGTRLWGVNPTGNPFYMKPRPVVRTGLKFCIGCFHGYTTDPAMGPLAIESKEDYERSILYYLADGATARFDWLTTNNRYAATPGGLGTDRDTRNATAAAALVARWPGLVRYKNDSVTEIRLTPPRKT